MLLSSYPRSSARLGCGLMYQAWSLMPDVTPSRFRSQANGIINFMGGIGSIIATLGGSVLYAKNPAYPFWLGSGLIIVSITLLFFNY